VPLPSEEGEPQDTQVATGYYPDNQSYRTTDLPKRSDISAYETSALDTSPDAEAIRQIQQARSQLIIQAISAKSRVQFDAGTTGSGGSGFRAVSSTSSNPIQQLQDVQSQLQGAAALLTGAASDPMAQYQQQLQAAQQIVGTSGGMQSQPTLQRIQSGNDGYSQFDGNQSRWDLGSKMQTPKKYTILAGDFIPGMFITGINSDLPGQITGQVAQNVYDSATGKHLLVPQGAKLVGEYASDVVYGQERVLFGWKRINFPDGRTMDIGSMQGSDSAGYAGVKDIVNHHFWRIFGSATMMSFVTAGIEITQDDGGTTEGNRNAGDALSEALGQQIGQAAAQMIMKNLNIAPTIEIRPGNRFNVVVTKDIVFDKPYVDFDY
jgi:type IV secretion system protein VirB10